MDEPDEPRMPRPVLTRPLLDPMSVAELHDYINQLRGEISRAETALSAKESHRSAADAFFRQIGTLGPAA